MDWADANSCLGNPKLKVPVWWIFLAANPGAPSIPDVEKAPYFFTGKPYSFSSRRSLSKVLPFVEGLLGLAGLELEDSDP